MVVYWQVDCAGEPLAAEGIAEDQGKTMTWWNLFSADENGAPKELVGTVEVPTDADITIIRWKGRLFVYQDNGAMHVETAPFESDAPAPRAKVQHASAKLEAFYRDSLIAMAKIAREKYGDEPKVLHMIAALGKAAGMMVCACFPNERELARETAIVNMDDAIKRYAQGEPSPMRKQ